MVAQSMAISTGSTEQNAIHGTSTPLEAIETNEQLYRSLFEDAPVAYHEINTHGIMTRVNRAECALLGFKAEDLLGHPVWELIDAEEQKKSQEAVRLKISLKKPLVPFERTYR